jgi:HIRAN domain
MLVLWALKVDACSVRPSVLCVRRAGMALMLCKEPSNPHDPNAIAVQTLSGERLGYVPREHTARFRYDTTFARVQSVGLQPDAGLYGMQVGGQAGAAHEPDGWTDR